MKHDEIYICAVELQLTFEDQCNSIFFVAYRISRP